MEVKYIKFGKFGIIVAFCLGFSSLNFLNAQQGGNDFLASVEKSNFKLQAARERMEASVIASAVGNGPDDPLINYGYMPGNVEAMGVKQSYVISQSLEFPTVYYIKNKMAKGIALAAEYQYLQERQKVLQEAMLCYNEYLCLLKRKKEYLKRFKQAEYLLSSFKREFETGNANILELNKAKIQFLNSKSAWQLLVKETESTEKKLQLLNGNTPFVISDSTLMAFPVLEAGELKDQIRQLNPELLYLNQQIIQSAMNVRLIRNQSLPDLMFSYEGESVPDGTYRGLRAGISLPLWNNRNKGSLARAEAEYAKLRYVEKEEQLFNEAENMLRQINEYQKLFDEYHKTLTDSENLTFLNKALEMGQISIIDYFTELSFYYDTVDHYLELEATYYEMNAMLYSFLW